MKIAIPTAGTDLHATVGSQFGRADNIMIIDSETREFEIVENAKNLNAPQGAGIQAAQLVTKSDAQWLLTGHCGPKAYRVLSAAEIQVAVGVSGTIEEAIDGFLEGKYSSSEKADVEGHWA